MIIIPIHASVITYAKFSTHNDAQDVIQV